MAAEALDRHRCEYTTVFLSLDLVVPFYSEMGLLLKEPVIPEFVATLRAIIEARGGVSWTNPVDESFSDTLLRAVEKRCDVGTRICLEEWLIYDFEMRPSERPQLNAWSEILSWCAKKKYRWDRLLLPVGTSELLRRDFLRLSAFDDLDQTIDDLEQSQKSEWDRYVFMTRNPPGELYEPYAVVSNNIYNNRIRRAIIAILDAVSPDEELIFWHAAQDLAQRERLTPTALSRPSRIRVDDGL